MTMTYTYYGRKKKTGEEKEDVFTTPIRIRYIGTVNRKSIYLVILFWQY